MRCALCVLAVTLLIGLADAAEAQTLKLDFTATVTISEPHASMPAVGEIVSGQVVFAQGGGTYAPHLPCGSQCSVYEFHTPYSIAVDFGTQQAGRQYFQALVGDDWSLFGEPLHDEVEFGSSTVDFVYVLVLRGPVDTFSGVTVPGPDVLQSMMMSSHLEVFASADILLFAPLSSLQVSVVPELPTVAYLLVGGVLPIARRIRRPRQAAQTRAATPPAATGRA